MTMKASSKYYTILTKTGQAKIANALAYGRQLQLKQFALGDGNGASYDPNETQTALKKEVYRANVGNVVVSDETINMLEINMAVPADVGGFIVREMGIFDQDNDLIAISKTPDDPKPASGSGAAKDVVYRLFIIVTNTDAIEIKIDPTVAVATKAEVEAAKKAMKQYVDSEIAKIKPIVVIPQGQEVERKPNQLYFKVTDQQSSSGANNVVAGPNNMQLEVQDIIEPVVSNSGINFE